MLPEQFGRYRLDVLIGRGGMGEIYRAYDTEKERVVALKRLPPFLASDSDFAARFRRESKIAGQLREPHVIPIHDYGEIDGRLFIDMRLVDGIDLADILARDGPLEPGRAVNIVMQIAAALDAAHAEGLVHRDVKPSNTLITGDDYVYLVDFGIARAAGATALTGTGVTPGTLHYMAPERFHGGGDHRVDVYALACLLHETLTGERPFRGEGLPAQMYAHVNVPPPAPSTRRAGIPSALDAVVARGMAKHPDARYRAAGAMAAAARSAMEAATKPAVRSSRRVASPRTSRPIETVEARPAIPPSDLSAPSAEESRSRVATIASAALKRIAATSSSYQVAIFGVAMLTMIVALPLFVAGIYLVPAGAMETTLHGCVDCTNDRILVDKLSYLAAAPQPGEIVVFRKPDSWGGTAVENPAAVSRAIASGGQTVQCCDLSNRVLVDGEPLDEPYIYYLPEAGPPRQQSFGPFVVPQDHLWMMGDSRNNSSDARAAGRGAVPVDNVIGQARLIVLPLLRMSGIGAIDPQTGNALGVGSVGTVLLLGVLGGIPLLFTAFAARLAARMNVGRVAMVAICWLVLMSFIVAFLVSTATADAPGSLSVTVEVSNNPFVPATPSATRNPN